MPTDINAQLASAIIACAALIVSVFNFRWTMKQKKSESVTSKRKLLTDLIYELLNVSTAFEQVRSNEANGQPQAIGVRRLLNSRRRFLVNYAEQVAAEIESQVSDIEYQTIAIAWDSAGNREKAKIYWEKCVEASPSSAMRVYNLRGYARFLFGIGQIAQGRDIYNKATLVEHANLEAYRFDGIETLLMWAKAESEYDYNNEANRLIEMAKSEIERLSHAPSRQFLKNRIQLDFPDAR
jgi:tetratricopeptide (TPR) repeat protein